MKVFLKNRLDYIYLLMCILNYALIFFIGAVVTISIQRIIDIARARSFMDMLDYLPGDGLTNFIFSMICSSVCWPPRAGSGCPAALAFPCRRAGQPSPLPAGVPPPFAAVPLSKTPYFFRPQSCPCL